MGLFVPGWHVMACIFAPWSLSFSATLGSVLLKRGRVLYCMWFSMFLNVCCILWCFFRNLLGKRAFRNAMQCPYNLDQHADVRMNFYRFGPFGPFCTPAWSAGSQGRRMQQKQHPDHPGLHLKRHQDCCTSYGGCQVVGHKDWSWPCSIIWTIWAINKTSMAQVYTSIGWKHSEAVSLSRCYWLQVLQLTNCFRRLPATSMYQECSGAAMAASRKMSLAQVQHTSHDQIIMFSARGSQMRCGVYTIWIYIWYCGSITCFVLPIALQPTLPSIGHSIAPANLGQPG